jgi:hypothetical protein
MVRGKAWAAALILVGASGAIVAVVHAQGAPKSASRTDKAPALTAMDYIEIQQLLARYAFALDTGADDGYMYADLYTPDGVFNGTKGRDDLAKLARGGRRGPANTRNLMSYPIIRPSAEGATGILYAQAINFGENRQPTELDHYGRYEDVYVKTADGWRFKSRTFVGESRAVRPQAAPGAAAASPQSR